MIKKVICQGQEVDAIVNGDGETLATLTAAVENEAAYVIPTGTLDVTQNGDYNVREKESIHVQVEGGADPVAPTLTVSEDGVVTASGAGVVQTTHQLSSEDDPNFTEENIAEGVILFGKTGTHMTPTGSVTLTENGTYDVTSKASAVVAVPAPAPKTPTIQVAQDGLITVSGDGIVTTTHKLSEDDDPSFTSANIAKNATIFGKPGAHEGGGVSWADISSGCSVISAGESIGGVTAETIDSNVSDVRAILCIPKQTQRGIYIVQRYPYQQGLEYGIPIAVGQDLADHSGGTVKLILGCTQPNSASALGASVAYTNGTLENTWYAMKSPSSVSIWKKDATYKVFFMPYSRL